MDNIRLLHDAFKKDLLADPALKAEYDDLAEEFQLLQEMITARKKSGMTQEKVAHAMDTTPSAISRLESFCFGNRTSPSFSTLKKYAHALGCTLSIQLVEKTTRGGAAA